MKIETLEDWNAALTGCAGCCPMPECPEPNVEAQKVSRTLCAMTASPSSYSVGGPSPNFDPNDGGVDPIEANVVYQSMHVVDHFSQNDPDQDSSYTYDVTLEKDPPVVEDNQVGTPAIGCARTRVNGSYSAQNEFRDQDGNVTEINSIIANWAGENASPFSGADVEGTFTWETYDENGNVVDSGVDPITISYGPAWDGVWCGGAGPETTSTTMLGDSLRHEVTGCGRTLTVQFQNPHTVQSAFAAITTPDPDEEDWGTPVSSAVIASFVATQVDEEAGDLRLTGARHEIGRYRWRIPSDHEGHKFKIWWDEVFFPTDWDPEDPASPEPVVTEKSFVWSGPGDPNDPDDDSWFSPWSAVVRIPSATEGEVELCNVRFLCYESKAGAKPQRHSSFRTYIPPQS